MYGSNLDTLASRHVPVPPHLSRFWNLLTLFWRQRQPICQPSLRLLRNAVHSGLAVHADAWRQADHPKAELAVTTAPSTSRTCTRLPALVSMAVNRRRRGSPPRPPPWSRACARS
ncbi:hypothetical protein EJB05_15372, partial [Eragrostis curvula]